jgi:predicted flap endonuclease-1-like 5' DNA nuclease
LPSSPLWSSVTRSVARTDPKLRSRSNFRSARPLGCECGRDTPDDLASDRSHLFGELAQARAETARYRQLVIDLENQSPPPLLGAPGTPDNLKLIVGVGPVLERMLYQLGITTYRQIARWTEHDIDEFDAKLPEFPGRIRRDDWVTQARALHQAPTARISLRVRQDSRSAAVTRSVRKQT